MIDLIKLKDIPLLSWDTLRVGAVFMIVTTIIGIVLARSVIGLLLYVNFFGYIALKYYKTENVYNLFGVWCLSVGWSVFWRFLVFCGFLLMPFYVLEGVLMLGFTVSDALVHDVEICVFHACEIVALGWSVKRVEKISYETEVSHEVQPISGLEELPAR